MLRIAVVGDLSLQDPSRLESAAAAAWSNDPDIMVFVGDVHPGYSVVKKYASLCSPPNSPGKQLYAVPGNHDTDWDSQLAMFPRQWNFDRPECHLVGIDNSRDSFGPTDWTSVASALNQEKPIFLFVHKPLSTIVLPDGSTTNHVMGEGSQNADAVKLRGMLNGKEALCIHGHWHGAAFMRTGYADCLIDGRGGAAPQIGYTIVTVRNEGFVVHQVSL